MSGFLDFLWRRGPTPIEDATLGQLKYDGVGRWTGMLLRRRIAIGIAGGRRGPAPSLHAAACDAARNLSTYEARAREYLAATNRKEPWPRLTLAAISADLPDAEWIRRETEAGNPRPSEAYAAGAPCVALQFSIQGDRNVVEACFAAGIPVAWDYH